MGPRIVTGSLINRARAGATSAFVSTAASLPTDIAPTNIATFAKVLYISFKSYYWLMLCMVLADVD